MMLPNILNNYCCEIVNTIVRNLDSVDTAGLFTGKMGLALVLYDYSRFAKNKKIEIYANHIINNVHNELNVKLPLDFACGLTGIGWGIEYLIKNRFIEAKSDLVLEEIDDIILRDSIGQNYNDNIFGYGLYYLERLNRRRVNYNEPRIFSKLIHLDCLLNDCVQILIHKKYTEYKIQSIEIELINSMLWFFLVIYKRKLVKDIRIELILLEVYQNIEIYLRNTQDHLGKVQFFNISNAIKTSMKEKKIKEVITTIQIQNNDPITCISGDKILNDFIKISWQELIYKPYSIGSCTQYRNYISSFLNTTDDIESYIKKRNVKLCDLAGILYGIMFISRNV